MIKLFNNTTNINSLMLSLIICSNFISIIFSGIKVFNNGIIPFIILTSIAIMLINSTTKIKLKFNIKAIWLLLFLIIFFLLSLLNSLTFNIASYNFLEFLLFGCCMFVVSFVPFNYYNIIKYIMLISLLILINPIQIIESIVLVNSEGEISMGGAYAIIPCVMASIIHFIFFNQKKNIPIYLAYFINLIFLYFLIFKATRGVLICFLVLGIFIGFIFINKNKSRGNIMKNFMLLATLTTILIIFFTHIEQILLIMNKYLNELGLFSSTIDKTYRLYQSEGILGILNGRGDIYISSFELFLSSPIFGNGVGIYSVLYNTYPHNIFLQLLCEGGVLILFPFIVIMFNIIISIIKFEQNRNKLLLLMLLFSIVFPRLLVSSYLWREHLFWILLFLFFNKL